MTLLHNIRTVARYEAKTLRRSWFFRLFSLGALVIFTFMNIGLFSPVGEEDWGACFNSFLSSSDKSVSAEYRAGNSGNIPGF